MTLPPGTDNPVGNQQPTPTPVPGGVARHGTPEGIRPERSSSLRQESRKSGRGQAPFRRIARTDVDVVPPSAAPDANSPQRVWPPHANRDTATASPVFGLPGASRSRTPTCGLRPQPGTAVSGRNGTPQSLIPCRRRARSCSCVWNWCLARPSPGRNSQVTSRTDLQ